MGYLLLYMLSILQFCRIAITSLAQASLASLALHSHQGEWASETDITRTLRGTKESICFSILCLVGYLPCVGLKLSITAGVVGVMQSTILPALARTSFHIRNILSSTTQKQYLTSGPCSAFNTREGTIIIVHVHAVQVCQCTVSTGGYIKVRFVVLALASIIQEGVLASWKCQPLSTVDQGVLISISVTC